MIRSPEEWYQLVNEFERSGLSGAEFCRRHNLATSTFFHHRRKYAGISVKAERSSDFISISKSEQVESTQAVITVATPGGYEIKLNKETEKELLSVVLQVLQEAC